jgi:stage IV sporulation protein FB
MGWETRHYGTHDDESGGGFRRAIRRIFGENENPLMWALPLYTAWGVRVRIHIIFVLFIAIEMIMSLAPDRIGPAFTAMAIGSLFVLVLLHEYGHIFACRYVGGEADQILMWPLGGLASCNPPHNWKADLITTVGGPAVNLVLWPILGVALALVMAPGAWQGALFFNPFSPAAAMMEVRLSNGAQPFWLLALWWAYYINAVLFLFNVLVPMYPLDSGRIVHAFMWSRVGHRRATAAAANLGLVVAVILALIALTSRSGVFLLGIAIFGGFMCWREKQHLKMTADPVLGGYDFDRGYGGMPGAEEDDPSAARAARAAEKRRKEQEKEQAELDRLLAKIAEGGMGSLTGAEKRWLQRTSEKKRKQ